MTQHPDHHENTENSGSSGRPPRREVDRVAGELVPLSVWACAQQPSRIQRQGRYLHSSTAHPAKMLPALAATAISSYTKPGELVLDPMCGTPATAGRAASKSGITPTERPRTTSLEAATTVSFVGSPTSSSDACRCCGPAASSSSPPARSAKADGWLTSPPRSGRLPKTPGWNRCSGWWLCCVESKTTGWSPGRRFSPCTKPAKRAPRVCPCMSTPTKRSSS
ncbi:hypothetical protein HKK72_38985 [Actinomadura sp. HBU206391]|nr:hypothetical protein [Actinomadura sp. HBU206391]